jgi:hypothetical protein
LWGRAFSLPPAFQPAFRVRSGDAGQKPGGRLKARPHKEEIETRPYPFDILAVIKDKWM